MRRPMLSANDSFDVLRSDLDMVWSRSIVDSRPRCSNTKVSYVLFIKGVLQVKILSPTNITSGLVLTSYWEWGR